MKHRAEFARADDHSVARGTSSTWKGLFVTEIRVSSQDDCAHQRSASLWRQARGILSPIEPIGFMTRITRRWFRRVLLLMLAISAQVPACEYGQRPNGDGQATAYRTTLTTTPPPATPYV
jgi:hypothetical protein